jgi:hypothetical protein
VKALWLTIVAILLAAGCASAQNETTGSSMEPAGQSVSGHPSNVPADSVAEPTTALELVEGQDSDGASESGQPSEQPAEQPSAGSKETTPSTTAASPEPVPPPTATTPVTGEVPPDVMGVVMADLASRSGIAEAGISVVRSEQVVWSDGSLGCPLPGETYTQALVDGYWIVLEAGGNTYDYRAATTGYFRLCEGGGAPSTQPTG